jgi:hypothetical protein
MAFTNEYSVYPHDIDGYSTLPLLRNLVDEIRAEDANRLRDAIVKIEEELGVKPSGTYASVSHRLDMIGDAMAAISAHIINPGAHKASVISVTDGYDYFYSPDVEGVIDELAQLLPHRPDYIGDHTEIVPNTGIPTFVDGYGTKFIYNVSDWSGEIINAVSQDNEVKRTQMRPVNGIKGIHIFEISEETGNGIGILSYDPTNTSLYWKAPGDISNGAALNISGLVEGDWDIVYSLDTSKALRFARTSSLLPSGVIIITENLEIYSLDAVPGYFSIPSSLDGDSVGMQHTNYITRTSISSTGESRNQFMVSGIVYPADKGILVLQKIRYYTDAVPLEYFPIAVLNLGAEPIGTEPCAEFNESLRQVGQKVYIPSLDSGVKMFDTITLFDRVSSYKDYTSIYRKADGSKLYEDYPIDYHAYQLARYLIPVSNSYRVGGKLESPGDSTPYEIEKIASYRILHYKPGVDYETIPDPTEAEIYSKYDYDSEINTNIDNTVRFTNVYVDPNDTRPEVGNTIFLRPDDADSTTKKYLSGIAYYTGSTKFQFGVESNDGLFSNTYLKDDILNFTSNVFNFPNGTANGGKFGASVDIYNLARDPNLIDGYGYIDSNILFGDDAPRLPAFDSKAWYVATDDFYPTRRLNSAPNKFTNRAYITARFSDPFGSGDGYYSYGDQVAGIIRDNILINSYPNQSTPSIEYFTDEVYRVGPRNNIVVIDPLLNPDGYENFLFATADGYYTYLDGYINGDIDGYILAEWDSSEPLSVYDLQCGGWQGSNADDVCGLIYPQSNYSGGSFLPFQYGESVGIGDIRYAPTLPSYAICSGTRFYQRLFQLERAISSFRLRIVSSGSYPISFNDIYYKNASRFGKIEIKIPGTDKNKSTEWLDITKLHAPGYYEDGDGALAGPSIGVAGDITIPITFGIRNNADAGNMIAIRVTYFGSNPAQIIESKKRMITMLEVLSPE